MGDLALVGHPPIEAQLVSLSQSQLDDYSVMEIMRVGSLTEP